MAMLTVRVEHGAGGSFLELATAMVLFASRVDVTVVCRVNECRYDMFALAGEDPRAVVDRWRLMNGLPDLSAPTPGKDG